MHRLSARGIVMLITLTSAKVLTSLIKLLDNQNLSLTVGIALLACIQNEIHIIPYLLPAKGRHIQPYDLMGRYFNCPLVLLDPGKLNLAV